MPDHNKAFREVFRAVNQLQLSAEEQAAFEALGDVFKSMLGHINRLVPEDTPPSPDFSGRAPSLPAECVCFDDPPAQEGAAFTPNALDPQNCTSPRR